MECREPLYHKGNQSLCLQRTWTLDKDKLCRNRRRIDVESNSTSYFIELFAHHWDFEAQKVNKSKSYRCFLLVFICSHALYKFWLSTNLCTLDNKISTLMTNSTGPNKDDKYWRLNKKWIQTTSRELKGLLRIMMPDETETSKWNSLVGVSEGCKCRREWQGYHIAFLKYLCETIRKQLREETSIVNSYLATANPP